MSSSDKADSTYASYVPHDLKYNADFEDSLMNAVLDPTDPPTTGIRLIPPDSSEQVSDPSTAIRADAFDPTTIPAIAEDDLPLPLNDPRRKFTSPIPGINLTHPGGYLEGGPGLDPDMDTFPDDFLANNAHVSSAEELRGAVQREVEASKALLRERMQARREAKEKNEQVEKEIKTLTDQHRMELRIQERMVEEGRRKKEEKERRRREGEGSG